MVSLHRRPGQARLDELVDKVRDQRRQAQHLRYQLDRRNQLLRRIIEGQAAPVPQLEGPSNYPSWRIAIEAHLRNLGIFQHANRPVPPPETDAAALTTWCRDQDLCYSALRTTTFRVHALLKYKGYTPDDPDPHALWTALQTFGAPEHRVLSDGVRRLMALDRASFASTGAMLDEFWRIRRRIGPGLPEFTIADMLVAAVRYTHEDVYRKYATRGPDSLAPVVADLRAIQAAEDAAA